MTSLSRLPAAPPSSTTVSLLLPLSLSLLLSVFVDTVEAGNFLSSLSTTSSTASCTPVTTADPFDLEAYAVHPWYIQQQQVVRYQPLNSLYCVRASYTVAEDGKSVSVLNTANVGGVSGTPQNRGLTRLRALIEDTSGATPPSKLLVGPTFLPRFAYGPYWVVAGEGRVLFVFCRSSCT